MSEPDPDIAAVFHEEAVERLDRMVESLLALEAGQPPAPAVDSLFRDAHSIKGSAGMFGLEEPSAIAHAIEDVLADLRGRDAFPADLTDPLLRATDALRRTIDGEQGVGEEAVRELTSSFSLASGNGAATGTDAKPAASPSADATPRRSMRISSDKVDRLLDAVGETVLHSRRLEHVLHSGAARAGDDERIESELGRGDVLLDELQDSVIQMRTLPLSTITGPFARAVRDLAAANGREAELKISGADTQLDRMILDGISETITHLLRNAVAHGIEKPEERERDGKPARGVIELRAEQRGSLVAIEIADDGRGVAAELHEKARDGRSLADVLTEAGLTTAASVTDVAGRGVGLDAVKAHLGTLGGDVEVRSEPGRGTVVTLTVPLTLALLRVLMLERAGRTIGLPLTSVEEAITITNTVSLGGRQAIEVRGRTLPLADLAQVVGTASGTPRDASQAVIVNSSGRRVAVLCDRIVEEKEVVIKSLGTLLGGVAGYLGVAIGGDGAIALIVDPAFLAHTLSNGNAPAPPSEKEPLSAKVLVVDDQFTVRELQRSILEAAGYRVATARDGREALTMISGESDIGLVVTDLQMPDVDGIELLRTVRKDPRHASLPVVVVTACGDEEDRQRGADAGADAYIVKQEFDQQALLQTVDRLLAR